MVAVEGGVDPRAFGGLARLLDYPSADLAEAAARCADWVGGAHERAAAWLRSFERRVRRMPLGRLEELYTSTFELDAVCHPYVGYHLFGESYKRSLFLIKLKELYRAAGFDVSGELPDHLAVMLRYLGAGAPREIRVQLIRDALLPAVSRMLGGLTADREPAGEARRAPVVPEPYRSLLRALDAVLRLEVGEPAAVDGARKGG